MKLQYDHIAVVGDIHGQFYRLAQILDEIPTGALIIQVGDFEIGFAKPREEERLDMLNQTLEWRDQDLLVMRGNHDNPSYFKKTNYVRPNIKLLKDYSYITINNQKCLFVGGAISLNRKDLQEGLTHWEDSKIKYLNQEDLNKLDPCDILFLHSAPIDAYPAGTDSPKVAFFKIGDDELVGDLITERNYLTKLVKHVKPKEVYYGHFHESNTTIVYNTKYCLLDILEFKELKI